MSGAVVGTAVGFSVGVSVSVIPVGAVPVDEELSGKKI